jgi:integrase/recombinase XerD
MAQERRLDEQEIQKPLEHVSKTRHVLRNRAMHLLTHWAGLRVGEVACLRWRDVTDSEGRIKDEIRRLPDMIKGRHPRTVFVSAKLQKILQAYADATRCIDRNYPHYASQKSVKHRFSANSLAQTFALLYRSAGIEGASSHSGRRSFLTRIANQGTAIHLFKL